MSHIENTKNVLYVDAKQCWKGQFGIIIFLRKFNIELGVGVMIKAKGKTACFYSMCQDVLSLIAGIWEKNLSKFILYLFRIKYKYSS